MTEPVDAVEFPDTPWSLLAREAGDGDQTEFRQLLQLYWQPVFCAIRDGWRLTSDEAGSLCDRFLAELLSSHVGSDVKPPTRFRHYLRSELVQFMDKDPQPGSHDSRSGIAIDTKIETESISDEPESVFDRRWLEVVYSQALERTEERLTDSPEAYEVFVRADVKRVQEGALSVADSNALRVARTTFRRELIELVYESVTSLDDAREELRWLLS